MRSKSDLEAEVDALRQQLAALRAGTKDAAEAVTSRVKDGIDHAIDTGAGRAQAAFHAGTDQAHHLVEDAAARAVDAEEALVSLVRARPLLALGIAFAAGLVLGRATLSGGRQQ
ncbi:MAG: hypothetical protein AAGF79_09950 [Pseudomonadota bacterium]